MPAATSAVAAAAALLLAVAPAPHPVRTINDPGITESSGLARSARHPGLLWTHNDGGTVAQVVGVDRRGDTVARVTLAGVDPYDPEALAPGRASSEGVISTLYLGDIGDNLVRRPDVSVFRFPEPATLGDTTVTPQWYRFTYPDGPHDAEALLVGPRGRIMIATKALSGAGLYRAPTRLVTQDRGTNPLTRVAEVPALVTDGAYLPDGRFVLRTYSAVYLYDRPGHEVAWAELPSQPQGESVAADGRRLLVGSEGVHSQVLAVPVPRPTTAGDAAPPRGAGPVADRSAGPVAPWAVTSAAAALLLGGLAVVLRRRGRGSRRRRSRVR